MKMLTLEQPFERDVGGGVKMVTEQIRENQTGLVEAKVEVWNGKPLFSNIVLTGKAAERDKFRDAALKDIRAAKIKGVKGPEISAFLLDLDIKASQELAKHAKANPSNSGSSAPDDNPYRADSDGMYIVKIIDKKEVPFKMANFTAQIKADTEEDDGVEVRRVFDIEAKLNGRTRQVSIPVVQFKPMGWPIEHLGTNAVIFPGYPDHVRCAIQLFSKNVEKRVVYTHTGFRKINGEWYFLHAGGAIGKNGPIPDVSVSLGHDLSAFTLPDPPQGEDLKKAIRASLGILDVAPLVISHPLLATTYRAPLGDCDFSLHMAGPSGAGKSELVTLSQQHYGATFSARRLPASWGNTANVNEALAFTLKDVVMVVDDFAPTGSSADIQRMHRDADRLFRAAGNRAGRQRMRADTSIRPEKYPRGSILSTGEDVPRGKSVRARVLVSEVAKFDLNWDRLSLAQADASAGLYAGAMSGFIRWMAARYEDIQRDLKNKIARYRNSAAARAEMHKRTPEIVANLAIGLRYFLQFALQAGAINKNEFERLWNEGWEYFIQAAVSQSRYQSASDPVQIFFDLLQSAVASGRAHVADMDGTAPADPGPWGWRRVDRDNWNPQGKRIGWVDGPDLYLEKDASFAEVQALANQNGEGPNITAVTMHKRLEEGGHLVTTDTARGTLYRRKTIDGAAQSVLHLSALDFLGVSTCKKPDISDIDDVSGGNAGDIKVED